MWVMSKLIGKKEYLMGAWALGMLTGGRVELKRMCIIEKLISGRV